jgi:hypothetical protein
MLTTIIQAIILILIAWFFIRLFWKFWFEMILFVGAIIWFWICIVYNPFNQAQINVILFIILPLLGLFSVFVYTIPRKYRRKRK